MPAVASTSSIVAFQSETTMALFGAFRSSECFAPRVAPGRAAALESSKSGSAVMTAPTSRNELRM